MQLLNNGLQRMYFPRLGKQSIDQQIFNRKSISRQITHPQSLFKYEIQLFLGAIRRLRTRLKYLCQGSVF